MRFKRHKGKWKKDNEDTAEYVCSECGADVSIDDTNCPNCGEDINEIEKDYTCNNCGGDVSEEDTICPFCGEDVSEIYDEPLREFRKRQLWEKLPKKMMYQTFSVIIDYLLLSGKISVDSEGKIGWIFYPKVARRRLKKAHLFWKRKDGIYYR